MKTTMKKLKLSLVIGSAVLMAACSVQPQKLTQQDDELRVQNDLGLLFQDQEPISGPLTLNQSIARALKYNLDHRLKLQEEAVALGQLDVANISLLPEVAARASASTRNNADTTFNESKTATSTSSDRDIQTSDLSVSWNILDFAIGYVRAHQQADLALTVQERRRKVIHTIVNDTRKAYWQAVAAERALARMGPMLGQIRSALKQAQRQENERIGSPLDALTYQYDLMETLRQLEARSRQLTEARTQLAVLINVHPGTEFSLSDTGRVPTEPPKNKLSLNPEALELTALRNRSELKAELYQLRINQRESKVALLEMIPGLSFAAGINTTSDSFKVNSEWYDASLNISWNLMNIFKASSRKRLVNSQIDLSKTRRLALSMAVISQTNIARLRYQHARADFELAQSLASVQERITDHLKAGKHASTISEARNIQGQVRSLLTSLRRDMAYADMQAAYGSIFASIGVDPLPEQVTDDSVAGLADAIGKVQAQWNRGVFEADNALAAMTKN